MNLILIFQNHQSINQILYQDIFKQDNILKLKNYHYQLPLTQSRYFRRKTIDQSYPVASNVILVTVNPKPTVSISKSPSTTSSGSWPDGIAITLTATSGLSSYSWSPISGSKSTLSVTPTTTTTYNLTVTDANGCENNASTQVPITFLNPGTLNNQSICGKQRGFRVFTKEQPPHCCWQQIPRYYSLYSNFYRIESVASELQH